MAEDRGHMRILVVEDAPKMAELIRRVLVSERHTVDVAADGETALQLAQGPPYDAVILDRMLRTSTASRSSGDCERPVRMCPCSC
jgi:DNA-binding response OmpR family regulator